jgi:endoglucanase
MLRRPACLIYSLLAFALACSSSSEGPPTDGSGGAGAMTGGGGPLGAGGSAPVSGGGPPAAGGWMGSGAQPATGGDGSGSGGVVGAGGGMQSGGANAAGGSENATGGSATGGQRNAPSDGAVAAAAAMGKGVNLGQMFESTQHPRTLAAARPKIDAYYEKGFRNLRIPITWTENVGGDRLVQDASTGVVNRGHQRLREIISVVDYALSKPGLYVIINTHHEDTLKTESRANVLQQLWKDISDIFKDHDHRLLFEILNEPHKRDGTAMPAADLRRMTGLAYDEIRKVDPKRIILFGGNQWFGAHEVPEVWTSLDEVGGGLDDYLMVTFHHYDPWEFCGTDEGSLAHPWSQENQSKPMAQMANWAKSVGQGMPVYIGEWGVGWGSRKNDLSCNNVRKWYQTFDSVHAREHGQPTALWDDGGWFKVYDHGQNRFANNLVDCIAGECAWSGNDQINDGCR